MQTQSLRRQFLDYFKKQQHAIIASSSVVPHDDPTLLFTNAGMNQFKDVFLGKSLRDYSRAATSQKCIRVGGKHNDLDNVGHTTRHLTFFEMLGNFSFGDYFKPLAIRYAWELSTEVFGFEPDRIWPTVFRDDDEAFELWKKYVPENRITRFGEKENFWAMGDTGPCGPCSELLYDRGPKYSQARNPGEDHHGERFLEFWNLVFMQFNRSQEGVMQPLPKPSIDTGAGLERVVSLKMGVDTVFETDVLRSLIAEVENISGVPYHFDDPHKSPAFRVIADHMRCLAFAIADGAQPSNVDRGYVLRKVLRRAVRYGRTLGFEEPFLHKLLPRLIDVMGQDYKELSIARSRIAEILTLEEEAFIRTLRRGGNILNQVIEKARVNGSQISGDDAFRLKDTYGLPLEEILLLAKDNEFNVDVQRYDVLEQEAKERSRNVHKTSQQIASENLFTDYLAKNGPSEFLGYTQHAVVGKITALVVDGQLVKEMKEGQEGTVVLNQTPFYAEMGGQIGDTGVIKGDQIAFEVKNCHSPFKGVIAHTGKLEKGQLSLGQTVTAEIDSVRRQRIANNHTATHLLHWALHKVLGEHVKQAGSVVEPGRLRFDFSHHKSLVQKEIDEIEDIVNSKIRDNLPVRWYEISYEEAQKRPDIKQFFGEKYSSLVRVIDIDYSKELCGGTHTSYTGNIGLFRVAKEGSIAAGVRRIEAVTGAEAETLSRESERTLEEAAALLKTQPGKVLERIGKLQEEAHQLEQELKALKKADLDKAVVALSEKIQEINQLPILLSETQLTPEEMRTCAEDLMSRFPSAVLVLATELDGKCHVIARVSEDLIVKGIKANEIIKAIAPIIEGSGGGKPSTAQAGGKAPHKIAEALAKARELLTQ